jgi:hypothetical protein
MRGVALTREQCPTIHLSEAQRLSIEWHEDIGPEPDGGSDWSPTNFFPELQAIRAPYSHSIILRDRNKTNFERNFFLHLVKRRAIDPSEIGALDF